MEASHTNKLDWKTFGPELDNIVLAAINLVSREHPGCLKDSEAAAMLVEGVLRIADNTHRTIRFLLAQSPEVPTRKREYALSAGPLARTILDSLCTMVFALQDPGGLAQILHGRGSFTLVKGE